MTKTSNPPATVKKHRDNMSTVMVGIEMIRTDGLQMRICIDQSAVSCYAADMKASIDAKEANPFPPVTLWFDGEVYWISDGHHRLAAATKLGLQKIEATVHKGSKRDAILDAVGANATHGLPRSNAVKRTAVETLLKDDEWAKWSNAEIARRAGVSANFVGELRRISNPIIDAPRKVERNGVVFEQDTKNIGRKASPAVATPPATSTEALDDAAANDFVDDEEIDDAIAEEEEDGHVVSTPADEEPFESPPTPPVATTPVRKTDVESVKKAAPADGLDDVARAFNAPLSENIKLLEQARRNFHQGWGHVEGARNLKDWTNADAKELGGAAHTSTVGWLGEMIRAFKALVVVGRRSDGRAITTADAGAEKRSAKLS